MSTYTEIKNSRRLIWAGIVVGYVLALGVALANLNTEDGTVLSAIAFLGWLAIPPTLAVFSLDRRPSLLTLAAMAAALQGVTFITSIGLVELVPAIMWYLAARKRPREAMAPRGATWIRPSLAAATLLPLLLLFIHLDPLCTVTGSDGAVVRSYVSERAQTGWSLQIGGSTSTTGSQGGETTTCTSNRIVGWEAGASIAVTVLYVALVAAYWPPADQLAKDREARSVAGGI